MTAPQLALPFASKLDRAFWEFHRANPQVYRELERRALALHARYPQRRFGIALLYEAMRFSSLMETTGDPWKLNQSWRSRYARLLVEKRPELAGWITMRELKA
jgi:hypothetical protein